MTTKSVQNDYPVNIIESEQVFPNLLYLQDEPNTAINMVILETMKETTILAKEILQNHPKMT